MGGGAEDEHGDTHTFQLHKLLLLERRRVREGAGRDEVAGQEVADEGRAEAVAHAREAVLRPAAGAGAGAVPGAHRLGPPGHVLAREGDVLGAPGGVVEALGEGVVLAGAVLADGVLLGAERNWFSPKGMASLWMMREEGRREEGEGESWVGRGEGGGGRW